MTKWLSDPGASAQNEAPRNEASLGLALWRLPLRVLLGIFPNVATASHQVWAESGWKATTVKELGAPPASCGGVPQEPDGQMALAWPVQGQVSSPSSALLGGNVTCVTWPVTGLGSVSSHSDPAGSEIPVAAESPEL